MNSHDDEQGATFEDGYQAGKHWRGTEQTQPPASNTDGSDDEESAADAIERGRLAGHNYTPHTNNY